jgi:hypothetical protein
VSGGGVLLGWWAMSPFGGQVLEFPGSISIKELWFSVMQRKIKESRI